MFAALAVKRMKDRIFAAVEFEWQNTKLIAQFAIECQVGRHVDVWGTLRHVVIRGTGAELARHARGTQARLLIEPGHYEGPSTDGVERPTPLGRRARLQVAGLSSASRQALLLAPTRAQVVRPLDDYIRMVEALR